MPEPIDEDAALAALKKIDDQLHREYSAPEHDVHGVTVPTRAMAVDDLPEVSRRGETLDDVGVAEISGGEIRPEDDDSV